MNCIIVDDEPLGRKAIQLLIRDTPVLSLYGSFGDAVSAGKFMQASPVDLVFLDIKLPEISGTEVLRRMRKMNKTSPVIIMTAYPTIKNAVECTKLGAVAYLAKAFHHRSAPFPVG